MATTVRSRPARVLVTALLVTPGSSARDEPMDSFLGPARTLCAPGTATPVMYASTDPSRRPIAVTSSVLVPAAPWQGSGSRPPVAFAVGT